MPFTAQGPTPSRMLWGVLIVALVICVGAYFLDPRIFYQSYLIAFLFWSGFAIGALGLLLLHRVTGGRWGAAAETVSAAAAATLPLGLLLVVPLISGLRELYPWARPEVLAHDHILQHRQAYLNPGFFTARAIFYFVLWMILATVCTGWLRQRRLRTPGPTMPVNKAVPALGLILFVLSTTFAAIDWMMTLDSHWYSSIFGALVMVGSVLRMIALIVLVVSMWMLHDRDAATLDRKVLHDLGNLMFAFVILWTYLSLSQLIIIWPANLPPEITWYLDRVRGGWRYLTGLVAVIAFAIPFLLLLSRPLKRDPRRLRTVSVIVLLSQLIAMFWQVAPSLRKDGFALYGIDVVLMVAVGAVWCSVFLLLLRRPVWPAALMADATHGGHQ